MLTNPIIYNLRGLALPYVFLRNSIAIMMIVFFVNGCSNYKVVSPKTKPSNREVSMARKQVKPKDWIVPAEENIKDEKSAYAYIDDDKNSSSKVKDETNSAMPRNVAQMEERGENGELPSLIVTQTPPPEVIYKRGSHDTILADESASVVRINPLRNSERIHTPVTDKAEEMQKELDDANSTLDNYTKKLEMLENKSGTESADYYNLVAAINSALQNGTTTGNPILIDRWNAAQDKLNGLSQTNSLMNNLAVDLAYHTSKAAFILDSVKAAFELSGAVDEDHVQLTAIEDNINENINGTNRLTRKVNDELARLENLLRTERANMQTLSLGIAKGELYGQNLGNKMFKKAKEPDEKMVTKQERPNGIGSDVKMVSAPARKPLVIIRFDRPSVDYDKPLYTAISQALSRYPSAKFDLVTVSPSDNNPSKAAVAKNEANKNGEAVLNSLTKMGLPAERIDLSSQDSKDVLNSEVRIYLR